MIETPIFIVNLKLDIKKKHYMKQLLSEHLLDFNFIDAVNGSELDSNYIDKITNEGKSISEYGKILTKGELGCALSHISIYMKMINENIDQAIVFEDDIELTKGFHEFKFNIDKLPKDWELVLLGYYSNVATEIQTKYSLRYSKKISNNYETVRLVQLAFGTHGYLINKKGAEKLLGSLDKIIKPIDHYTGVDRFINMYAINPRVVMLNEGFKNQSSIAKERNVDKNNSKKWDSLSKRFLLKIRLLKLALNTKMFYNRIKVLKEYK